MNEECKHDYTSCSLCKDKCSICAANTEEQGNDSGFEKLDLPSDMVNQPAHYNNGDIECIDALKAALGAEGFRSYCRGNAIKYTWRAGLKFNKDEDLRKAVWYNRMAAGDDPRLDPTPTESRYQKDIPVPDLRVTGAICLYCGDAIPCLKRCNED